MVTEVKKKKLEIINSTLGDIGREGNGNPLQYSCLENLRDRGAWWAAIYGLAQSWIRLKQLSSSSSIVDRSSVIYNQEKQQQQQV